MSTSLERSPQADWVGNTRSFALAWGLPTLAIIGSGFLDPSQRMMIWVIALVWMGAACMANAKHCGRTHCRFTGPFFLLMTIPVILQGSGVLLLGPFGWWGLGVSILVGNVVLWWGSEALWGKFRSL